MSQERVSHTEFVRTEVEGLLTRAKRLREIAEKWEREAKDLGRFVDIENRPASLEDPI